MDSEDSDIVKADPSTESARLEFQQQAASGVDSNPRNSSLSARESTHNHKSDDWDQKRHPIDDRDDSHMLERSHNQRSQLENMENRSTQTSQVEAKVSATGTNQFLVTAIVIPSIRRMKYIQDTTLEIQEWQHLQSPEILFVANPVVVLTVNQVVDLQLTSVRMQVLMIIQHKHRKGKPR